MLELMWLEDIIDEKRIQINVDSIGSESIRVSNFVFEALGILDVDDLVTQTKIISFQRAAEISRYFNDMKQVFLEMNRVLKPHSYAVIIVGNNKVTGKTVETYKLLEKIAENCGFVIELVLRDPIRTRGMITKRHGNGGLIKDEYVLVLKKRG
jgi:hypothetical protein